MICKPTLASEPQYLLFPALAVHNHRYCNQHNAPDILAKRLFAGNENLIRVRFGESFLQPRVLGAQSA